MSNRPSVQLITNSVVAQYIHEISQRHQIAEPAPDPPEEAWSGAEQALDGADRLAA